MRTKIIIMLNSILVIAGLYSGHAYPNVVYKNQYINVGAPECAHCLAMALLGPKIGGMNVKFTPFNTLSTLVTSLLTNRMQIAQVDYPSLVSLISRKVPIVAISGEVNGGTDFVLENSIKVKPNDWVSLSDKIKKVASDNRKFIIATQYGTVQNVDIRLALIKHGINVNKCVEFVNIPFQGMSGALISHRVNAAVPVQPIASEITLRNLARHFSYLANQPAGNLTNVVILTRKFYNENPLLDKEIATSMVKLVKYIKTPPGRNAWKMVIMKYTRFDNDVVNNALLTLIPDYRMPLTKISEISNSMYENGLINDNPSRSVLLNHIKYHYLSEATGLTPTQLGK